MDERVLSAYLRGYFPMTLNGGFSRLSWINSVPPLHCFAQGSLGRLGRSRPIEINRSGTPGDLGAAVAAFPHGHPVGRALSPKSPLGLASSSQLHLCPSTTEQSISRCPRPCSSSGCRGQMALLVQQMEANVPAISTLIDLTLSSLY